MALKFSFLCFIIFVWTVLLTLIFNYHYKKFYHGDLSMEDNIRKRIVTFSKLPNVAAMDGNKSSPSKFNKNTIDSYSIGETNVGYTSGLKSIEDIKERTRLLCNFYP